MTTKQAINLLERISYSQHDVEKQEALEMAIRALEGDGDMISRKMAIDAINNCYCGGEDSCGEPWIYEDDAIKAVEQLPSAQPERLTDDDFEEIRIHLNAYKEKLCNQQRWEEAEEYQRIIDRFMAFASARQEYEPVTAEDFAKTMSENTIWQFAVWHGEALALMKEQGFVICKKAM